MVIFFFHLEKFVMQMIQIEFVRKLKVFFNNFLGIRGIKFAVIVSYENITIEFCGQFQHFQMRHQPFLTNYSCASQKWPIF